MFFFAVTPPHYSLPRFYPAGPGACNSPAAYSEHRKENTMRTFKLAGILFMVAAFVAAAAEAIRTVFNAIG